MRKLRKNRVHVMVSATGTSSQPTPKITNEIRKVSRTSEYTFLFFQGIFQYIPQQKKKLKVLGIPMRFFFSRVYFVRIFFYIDILQTATVFRTMRDKGDTNVSRKKTSALFFHYHLCLCFLLCCDENKNIF